MSQTTLPERILDWTQTYCETLETNYREYHRRMLTTNSFNPDGELSQYAKDQLDAIHNGTANLMKFVIKNGRKYYKIMQHEFDTFQDRNEYREGSVHAFVDKNTGEVFKPASYNAPAKHVRYDLRVINDRVKLHDPRYTGWSGGYLYMR